jgi:hypothetical protein
MPKRNMDGPMCLRFVLDQVIAKHDPEAIAATGRDAKRVASGLRGGSKGGHARAKNLTTRKPIGKKAAQIR